MADGLGIAAGAPGPERREESSQHEHNLQTNDAYESTPGSRNTLELFGQHSLMVELCGSQAQQNQRNWQILPLDGIREGNRPYRTSSGCPGRDDIYRLLRCLDGHLPGGRSSGLAGRPGPATRVTIRYSGSPMMTRMKI